MTRFIKLTLYHKDHDGHQKPVWINVDSIVSFTERAQAIKVASDKPMPYATLIYYPAATHEDQCGELVSETPDEILKRISMAINT